ncbi:MAG: hypothetical protein IPK26_02875 [Planctomycetes bacterium]|nr:hypothetical protein [Planctomycetota bacterium]
MVRSTAILLSVLTAAPAVAQNLFANPDFEAGNTGFGSDYSYSGGGNCCEGQYTVRATPNTFNGAFVQPPPVSPGSSQMMVINGSTTPGLRVWHQSVAVTAGVTYQLQLWGCTAVAGGPAILQWQVQGALIGSPFVLPTTTQQWVQNTATWVAPATGTVEVAIRNLNTARFPNDFYIDDVAMRGCVGCWTNYGDGWPGAIGVPGIWLQGTPGLGQAIEVRMVTVRASAELAVVVLGFASASLPTPFGGTLLVQPATTAVLAAPAMPTSFALPLVIPTAGTFVGMHLFAQFAHSDPTASVGFAFSRGLELIVGP